MQKGSYLYNARVTNVVDGDTVDAAVDLGFYVTVNVRFRLYGINTPELTDKDPVTRAKAVEAKQFTADKLLNKPVVMQTYKTDKYGRWLADIYVAPAAPTDKSVNQQLLEAHLAVPYFG